MSTNPGGRVATILGMDVTPHELRDAEINEVKRGYDCDAVDELLERAADTIEALQHKVDLAEQTNIKAAVDSLVVVPTSTNGDTPEPPNEYQTFAAPTDYLVANAYEVGGDSWLQKSAPFLHLGNVSVTTGGGFPYIHVTGHTPTYAVAVLCPIDKQAQQVPFRTTGEVVTALLRNDVAFAVELAHAVRGQVEAGELKILAIATSKRFPALPNVPTMIESGIPGFEVNGWYGLVFPAGVPAEIIDRTHKALAQILSRDGVRKQLDGIGAQASLSSPREFGKLIADEVVRWRNVAKTAGLEPN